MQSAQRGRKATLVDLSNVAEFAASQLARAAARAPHNAIRREIRLPFLRVTAHVSSASFANLCYEGLVARHTNEAPLEHLEIHVTSAAGDEAGERAVWSESSFVPGQFERVITGHRLRGYYHHDYRFWQFYDPAAARGLQAMAAPDRYPPWESASPLRAFLHWAYDELGMRLAHAATLGSDGRCVLLAGAGGSGKSGTTLAGILHGLASVGDDYVLIDRGPNRCAHAIFAKMKQDLDGLRRVGVNPFQLGGGRLNWQEKLEFHPDRVNDGALVDQLAIVAILLPKIAHAERTALRRARAAEAMLALAPSGLFQMPGCAANGVRFFSQLAREVPAYDLLLSEDPAEIAGTIQDFLQKGADHAG